MRRVVIAVAVIAGLSGALSASASTRAFDDMCSAPKEMKTDKWQSRTEVGGMTILIPQGFLGGGHSQYEETADTHFYRSGEHRSIAIGSGQGPVFVRRIPDIQESGECETVIVGRRVAITTYRWSVVDSPLEASGEAGPHFAAVARFYPSGASRELYVAFVSNAPSDLKYYHQLFWTVAFPGGAAAVATAPAAAATPAATVANVANAAPTSTITVGRVCSSAPPPTNLPAASAVIDSAVVGSLLAGAAPIPSGFEVIRLQFDAGGELAGLSASDSDLPEASQKELAAIVGTNLKTHDAKTPPSIYLRIDSSATGLRYSVVPPPSC